MQIRYLKRTPATIAEKLYRFASRHHNYDCEYLKVIDVPDAIAKRLLRNPRYSGWFEEAAYIHCDLCDFKSRNSHGVRLHRYTIHESENWRYACPYCNFVSINPGGVKLHASLKHKEHKGEKWKAVRYSVDNLPVGYFESPERTVRSDSAESEIRSGISGLQQDELHINNG